MKHGARYPRGGKSNNSGGGTQSKAGTMYTPLCRNKQFTTTMGAMMSRTRSGYPATRMNNLWQGISEDQGGNILGWSPE
jgi:hypothetical protein